MPEQEQPDLFDQLFAFLSQILMPVWNDLIALIPYALIGLALLGFLYLAWIWRRASARNRPRLPRRLAVGEPPPGVHLPGPSRWPFVVPIGLTLLFFGLVLPVRDEAGEVVLAVNPLLVGLGLLVSLVAMVGWLRDAMKEWRTAEVGVHAPGAHEADEWAAAHGTPTQIDARVPALNRAQAVAALESGHGALVVVDEPVTVAEPPPGVHMPGPSPWPFFAPIGITMIFFGLLLSAWLVVGGLILAIVSAAGWLREASREWRSTEEVGHAVPQTHDPVSAWPRRLVPIFVGIIGLSLALMLLPRGFEWLNTLRPPEATPTPITVPAVPEIVAPNAISFDRDTLIVPAGRDFELIFRNDDAGVPHNVEIDESSARETVLFQGEIINGVAEITYNVPAMAEGDYYFLCSVHPNMNGTVLARPETGDAGGGGSPPAGSPATSPGGSPATSPPAGSPATSPAGSPATSPAASPGSPASPGASPSP